MRGDMELGGLNHENRGFFLLLHAGRWLCPMSTPTMFMCQWGASRVLEDYPTAIVGDFWGRRPLVGLSAPEVFPAAGGRPVPGPVKN